MQDEKLDQLISALEEQNRKKSLQYSFFHGVLNGLGATVGVALVLTAVGYLLQQLAVFPRLRDAIQSLTPQKIQQSIQLPSDDDLTDPLRQLPTPNETNGASQN